MSSGFSTQHLQAKKYAASDGNFAAQGWRRGRHRTVF
jgi:hypothetical protein